MIDNSSLKENKNNINFNQLTQTIILNKSNREKTISNKNALNTFENKREKPNSSFKINKLSYFNVKKKCKVNFSQGKIYLNSDRKTNYYLDLTFYDTSLHLRFQGFIDTKRSSFFIDINEPNCVRINKIIGLIYYVDENGENKHDTIVTNIYINFQSKKDINFFFNSLC